MFFVDRPNIMDKMKTALHRSTVGCKIVALHGLGCMGKSQLMHALVLLRPPRDYKYIFWLNVDGKITANDSFRKPAINLGLDKESVKQLEKEGRIIQWVSSWLEKQRGWLFALG